MLYVAVWSSQHQQEWLGLSCRLGFTEASRQMERSSLWEHEALSAALLWRCVCEEQVRLHFELGETGPYCFRWSKNVSRLARQRTSNL